MDKLHIFVILRMGPPRVARSRVLINFVADGSRVRIRFLFYGMQGKVKEREFSTKRVNESKLPDRL